MNRYVLINKLSAYGRWAHTVEFFIVVVVVVLVLVVVVVVVIVVVVVVVVVFKVRHEILSRYGIYLSVCNCIHRGTPGVFSFRRIKDNDEKRVLACTRSRRRLHLPSCWVCGPLFLNVVVSSRCRCGCYHPRHKLYHFCHCCDYCCYLKHHRYLFFSPFYYFLGPVLQRSDVIQHELLMASGMHQLTSPSRSRHRSRSKSPKRHGKPVQPPTKALRTLRISSRSADEDDVFRLNPGALQNREWVPVLASCVLFCLFHAKNVVCFFVLFLTSVACWPVTSLLFLLLLFFFLFFSLHFFHFFFIVVHRSSSSCFMPTFLRAFAAQHSWGRISTFSLFTLWLFVLSQ